MFLLNYKSRLAEAMYSIFTIQNVPIKLVNENYEEVKRINLQYKMFLLNEIKLYVDEYNRVIYNTKCSY